MKKIILTSLSLFLISCITEAIEDAKDKITDIDTSGCINMCSLAMLSCSNNATGICIDVCESAMVDCNVAEETCLRNSWDDCLLLTEPQRSNCYLNAQLNCSFSCYIEYNTCQQSCFNQLQVCISDGTACVSACVDRLEEAIQDV